MAWNTMRATYDQQVGKIYKDWQKTGNNRNKSFQDFVLDSEAYENATNQYRTQIGEFGARGGLNYKSPSKGSAASGQTSGKVKWSVVQ
jgi:hypothetical protein